MRRVLAAHSSPPCTLASASRIISGRATAPTTVCERPTSGAWKTKNRMPRIEPVHAGHHRLAQRIARGHDRRGGRGHEHQRRRLQDDHSHSPSRSRSCVQQAPSGRARRMRAARAVAWLRTGVVMTIRSATIAALIPADDSGSSTSTARREQHRSDRAGRRREVQPVQRRPHDEEPRAAEQHARHAEGEHDGDDHAGHTQRSRKRTKVSAPAKESSALTSARSMNGSRR